MGPPARSLTPSGVVHVPQRRCCIPKLGRSGTGLTALAAYWSRPRLLKRTSVLRRSPASHMAFQIRSATGVAEGVAEDVVGAAVGVAPQRECGLQVHQLDLLAAVKQRVQQ